MVKDSDKPSEKEDKKARVFSYIASKEYVPLKYRELIAVLDVPCDDEDMFKEVLFSLMAEGKIYVSKKGRYIPVSDTKTTAVGVLHCNARGYFGFVSEPDGKDIYIPGKSHNTAIDGDTVIAAIDKKCGRFKNAHDEGHVLRVLKRAHETITGTVYKKSSDKFSVHPDNTRIYASVKINSKTPDELIGKRVCVRVTKYDNDGKIYGEIEKVLGDSDSVKGYIDGIVADSGVKTEFDSETITESEKIIQKIGVDEIQGRLDLRDKLVFTIDGADSRDFDDAVSLEMSDNGNYKLGVHIADVTNYVKEGTALDKEAFLRGNSVYTADRVIPMLPERLSNGICSLNPNEDRLTLSVISEIDKNGDVVSYDIRPSVIRSDYRMTYEDTNKIFAGDGELCKKYAPIVPTLEKMRELSKILSEYRKNRGAIQFDFPEVQIDINENAEPVNITSGIRGDANKMIEQFMLTANEIVAEFAYWAEIPFIYRVHEAPSEDKITEFNGFLKNFGLRINGKVHPKSLQRILDSVKGTPEELAVSDGMLHSLMKADYRTQCIGHFGLAAKYYCHFTSPIRRYPDLVVHRILKEYLKDGTADRFKSAVSAAASHSSDTEVTAEFVERGTDDFLKARYMADGIGEKFDAIIVGTADFGIFVMLDNGIEGMICLRYLKDDYYEYDASTHKLTGRKTKRVYAIGDKIRVVLVKVDLRLRQIDFIPEHNATHEVLKRFKLRDNTRPERNAKSARNARKKKKKKNKKH